MPKVRITHLTQAGTISIYSYESHRIKEKEGRTAEEERTRMTTTSASSSSKRMGKVRVNLPS